MIPSMLTPCAYTKAKSVIATHSRRSGPAEERARGMREVDRAVTMP
ncbi:hypothetical protein ACWD0A_03195 [Streptomyces sp. NPDC002867]